MDKFAAVGFGFLTMVSVAGCGMVQPPSCDGSDRSVMNAGKWDGAMSLGCPRRLGVVFAQYGETPIVRIVGGSDVSTQIEFADGETVVAAGVSGLATSWSVMPLGNAVLVKSSEVFSPSVLHIVTKTNDGRERQYHVALSWGTPGEQKTALLKYRYRLDG